MLISGVHDKEEIVLLKETDEWIYPVMSMYLIFLFDC